MSIRPGDTVTVCCPAEISQVLPREFGVLTWNIYKKNKTMAFKNFLNQMHQNYPTDLLIFQEVAEPDRPESFIPGFETLYLSNLQMKKRAYGVATASSTRHVSNSYLISHHQEFLLQTHKSLLMSVYPLADGQQLVVVNVHAINFKNLKAYQHEMSILIKNIRRHQGPMIISGDFNTWSKKRHNVIETMSEQLGLKKIHFDDSFNIKKFLKKPLDLTLYRGLNLQFARSFCCDKVSDHNPLYARFSL